MSNQFPGDVDMAVEAAVLWTLRTRALRDDPEAKFGHA